MQFLLEAAGYDVASFLDGDTFLDRIRFESPACVIIDYKLRRTNGLELVRSLRDAREDIPAIIITGHPDPAIRKRVREAGLPLIEKPFSQNLLLCAVKAASELNEPGEVIS